MGLGFAATLVKQFKVIFLQMHVLRPPVQYFSIIIATLFLKLKVTEKAA